MSDEASISGLRRARWRLRGAWMWPSYVALTLVDGFVLHHLPFGGDGWDLVPCVIAAGFANLAIVAVFAPLAGLLVRRRRRDLPRVVATDYAGTALLLALTAAFTVAGVIHRPLIVEKDRDKAAQFRTARAYFAATAPPELRRNLARINAFKLEADLYRTCLPGPDPKRELCAFINTDTDPPGVRRDTSRESNASFQGRFGAFRAK